MKKLAPTFALSVALALGVGSVACSGQVENTNPQTSASALSKAPIGANTHGLVKMVGEALGEVALRPDQRTELEKLATTADARHVALTGNRKELMLAVADQIEKGSIDRAALQPKIDLVVGDMEKARPDDRADLARVHAILDPDQRNAFVDALEAKFKAKKDEFKGHHGMAGMKQLGEELKLTDDQRSQIKDVMKAGMKEHAEGGPSWRDKSGSPLPAPLIGGGKKTLEAFRTDKFDANVDAPNVDTKAMAEKGTTRMIGFAEKVLPILTPEQRKLAADKIRTMAEKGEMGPLGH